MSFQILATIAILIVGSQAKTLQLKSTASVSLTVSISGQNDIVLLPGATAPVMVGDDFAGSISAVPQVCDVCNGPRSQADIKLSSTNDQYAVNLVNGFNLAIKIIPMESADCASSVCAARINHMCPIENRVTNNLGEVVACKNSPLLFSKVCPEAVISEGDVTKVVSCNTALGYLVTIG